MIVGPQQLRPISSFLLPFIQKPSPARCLHQLVKSKAIPPPTPFVPDTKTFLTLIGRNLSQHAEKIDSWNKLFTLNSDELKDLGMDPPRTRRYFMSMREKFRKGLYGIGGDIQFVENGIAQLRVAEVTTPRRAGQPTTFIQRIRKIVVNVPAGENTPQETETKRLIPVKGFRVKGAHTIIGPHALQLKGGSAAILEVKEGLWEEKRGRKIDGGERRQAEVRAKRRGEEKRAR